MSVSESTQLTQQAKLYRATGLPLTEKLLRDIRGRIVRALTPERVILFGSYAQGRATLDSDLDLLVIEPHVTDRHAETVRLAEVLRVLRIPVDVVVLSAEKFAYWKDTPNTLAFRAAREGRAYEQVA